MSYGINTIQIIIAANFKIVVFSDVVPYSIIWVPVFRECPALEESYIAAVAHFPPNAMFRRYRYEKGSRAMQMSTVSSDSILALNMAAKS